MFHMHNLCKLAQSSEIEFGTAGAPGGGRFAGSCNQYWIDLGQLWKSSGIKRCSAG